MNGAVIPGAAFEAAPPAAPPPPPPSLRREEVRQLLEALRSTRLKIEAATQRIEAKAGAR